MLEYAIGVGLPRWAGEHFGGELRGGGGQCEWV